MSPESIAYEKHKNLKFAANELGVKWQTLYCRLKNQGVSVCGDKQRYGNDRDKIGIFGEYLFKKFVPNAKDLNASTFQSKCDYEIFGLQVDVKTSKPRQLNKRYESKSWSFSFKKQSLIADFIVCFCLDDKKDLIRTLLVPKEFFIGLQTVSVSCNGASKWIDYAVDPKDLNSFFKEYANKG